MEAVTEYIKRNSNGRKQPVRGSTIASAFGVSGVRVRNMGELCEMQGRSDLFQWERLLHCERQVRD